jgi:hypothetical protein
MGWRDRDYAKFRKDELDALLGSSGHVGRYTTGTKRGAVPQGIGQSNARHRRRGGSGLLRAVTLVVIAVVATGALLGIGIVTGQVKQNSLLAGAIPGPAPALVVPQVQLPVQVVPPVSHPTTRIAGTRLLQYGSTLTLRDSHTPMSGNIVVSGRWATGSWETLAVARGSDPTFSFRIPLDRRGVLRLRIAYPDGGRAVGTYTVR